ncbi:MAG: hypothetical protein FWD99_08610 [Oscillospiraceae bacterium]|nr:hypothetical protein [Oscillospiraceae bacterium]
MEKSNKLVEIAFRKLKAHIYFDKTALPLRDKVVKFENDSDFKKNLKKIADTYDKNSLDKNSPIVSKIRDSISVRQFPKAMYKTEDDNEKVISVGIPGKLPKVSEQHYFIDMDVEGHILGVLWIMMFGRRLDDLCFENSRGNRLRKNLIWDEDEETIEYAVKDSPVLFEPYFAQYSLWRDDGLSCAEELLSKGHDALILTLDLKEFYYNAGVTKAVFDTILKNEGDPKKRNLHAAIFSIIECYSKKLSGSRPLSSGGNVLPIGFLPSAVLANWCLSNFDKGILDFWNPSYYGRYVDDIIIVEKIEKGSKIYKNAREDKLTKNCVIDYYLGRGRRKDTDCFVEKAKESEVAEKSEKTHTNDDSAKGAKGSIFRVNEAFCLSPESEFVFESEKTRTITLFADNNSTALINKFKEEIHKNVSEFRLMPDMGEEFSQDDFSYFYRIENDATINKLRGIKDIMIDKYELSKFLGKYLVVSRLIDDGSSKKFTKKIGEMLNDHELIEYYILWERIFEIFIIDKEYIGFINFANRVKKAIDTLTVIKEGADTTKDVVRIRESLKKHLLAALNRVLSLVWGENATEIVEALSKIDPEICPNMDMREAYIKKHMSNKYIASVPTGLLSLLNLSDEFCVNFTNFYESFEFLNRRFTSKAPEDKQSEYKYFPYFRQAQDIAAEMFMKSIYRKDGMANKRDLYEDYKEAIHQGDADSPVSTAHGLQLSDDNVSDPLNIFLSVDNKKAHKLKIAIANINMNVEKNLENILKRKRPDRTSGRYRALAKLVNEAIIEKADMLIFPENYIPFEWLPSLEAKAAREGMAIITGVEHMLINNKEVHNYTAVILPFKYHKTIPTAAVSYQLKRSYSPEEKRVIEGYGFEVAEEKSDRLLYRWRDCYFPVYCCYEFVDIRDRAKFISWADMIVAVNHNKDTNYFGSIVESLSRDLHCYCVQVNTSKYGDSRIVQPKGTIERNMVVVKGGKNPALLVEEIDIQALREFQIKSYELQKGDKFKPTPPGVDKDIILAKRKK